MTHSTDPVDDHRPAGVLPESATVGEDGAIHWPSDEEASRAPGSALLLLVVSLVGGALYIWFYAQLLAGFDWLDALSLRSSALVVVGGGVLMLGAILFIRHGLIWASRLGALLVLAAPVRLCVERIVVTGGAETGSALLSLLRQTWPAMLVLAVSFSPALGRWRRRRQQVVKERATTKRTA
jgi:hypothetical protein